MISDISTTLLWTNPNPTSDFTGNIQVNGMSAYKYIIVGLKCHKTYANKDSIIIKFEYGSSYIDCSWILTKDSDLYSRYLNNSSSENSISFGDCYNYNLANRTNTVGNGYLIPLHIYGTNFI